MQPETASASEGPSLIYPLPSIVERIDLAKLFPGDQPLEVELGCGDSSFLVEYARRQAGHNFIGVERLLGRIRKLDRKGRRAGLTNLRGVRIESSYFLEYLLPPHSAVALHIYFPDPWPKRRHQARRLISPDFVTELHRTMTLGGTVNCATDHLEYFEWIQRAFQTSGRFAETEPVALPPEARTDFEKEFVAAGKQVYRCQWLKR